MPTRVSGAILIVAILASVCLAVPAGINYQGKLTDSDGVGINSNLEMVFRLFDAATGGTLLWEETHDGVNEVTVTKGLFDVELGSITPLNIPFEADHWLEIVVDGTALTPRVKLLSSPYAYRAAIADSVANLPQSFKKIRADGEAWLLDSATIIAGAGIDIDQTGPEITITATGGGGSLWTDHATNPYIFANNNDMVWVLDYGENYAIHAENDYSTGVGTAIINAYSPTGSWDATSWQYDEMNAGVKGFIGFGGDYTASVAGYYNAYGEPSAAVLGAYSNGTDELGALGYYDGDNFIGVYGRQGVWGNYAGWFEGNFHLEPQSEPLAPVVGDIYADNVTNKAYFYNGASWVDMTATPGAGSSLWTDHATNPYIFANNNANVQVWDNGQDTTILVWNDNYLGTALKAEGGWGMDSRAYLATGIALPNHPDSWQGAGVVGISDMFVDGVYGLATYGGYGVFGVSGYNGGEFGGVGGYNFESGFMGKLGTYYYGGEFTEGIRIQPQDVAPAANEGAIYANSLDNNLYYYDGTSWVDLTAAGGGGGVSGSGTANYIPLWTPDGTTLGDSKIRDEGTYSLIHNPGWNPAKPGNFSVAADEASDYFALWASNFAGTTTPGSAWTHGGIGGGGIYADNNADSKYFAGIFGFNWSDAETTAAIIGADDNSSNFGALAYRANNKTWAGYFRGLTAITGSYQDPVAGWVGRGEGILNVSNDNLTGRTYGIQSRIPYTANEFSGAIVGSIYDPATITGVMGAMGYVNNVGEYTAVWAYDNTFPGPTSYALWAKSTNADGYAGWFDGNFHLEPKSTAIALEGNLHANSTDNKLYYYDGTSWVDLTSAGGGGGLWTDNGTFISANTNTNARVYDEGQPYGLYYSGSNKYGVYGYTSSTDAGASGVYGYAEAFTAGTGYGYNNSIAAVKGHCLWGNDYHFGLHGDTYASDGSPTAGVIGTFVDNSIWGALAYKHTDDNLWAGYFNGDVYISESLGIGIADPVERVHIDNGSSHTYQMFTNEATGRTSSDGFKIGVRDDGIPFIWSYENLPMHFGTNMAIRTTIDGAGNVGIGTITPTAQLHTTGSVRFAGAGTPGLGKVLTSDATGTATWETPSGGGGFWSQSGTNLYPSTLTWDVGIGTSSPSGILHVGVKNATKNELIIGDNITAWVSEVEATIGNTTADALLYIGQSTNNKGFLIWDYNPTPSDAVFLIGTYSGNNNMSLQSAGGNVGVGTTSPTTKLDVDGQIRIRGGVPGVGKVLTSDATGTATWETPTGGAGLWTDAGTYISANTNTNARVHDEGQLYGLYYQGSNRFGLYGQTSNATAGASGVYGYSLTSTAGTGYGYNNSITAVKGHCLYGNAYHFGVQGDTYSSDGSPTAGVIGTFIDETTIWGALAYKHTDDNLWAGYFNGDVKVEGTIDVGQNPYCVTLTAGEALVVGDVVAVSTTANLTVVKATTGSELVIGVVAEAASLGNPVKIAVGGVVQVRTSAAVTRANFARVGTTAGQAIGNGTSGSSGDFGIFLETTSGTGLAWMMFKKAEVF
jgi:hypothetical protein